MYEKLDAVEQRFIELEHLLVDSDVIANRAEYAKLAKERSGIDEIVRSYRTWKDLQGQIEGNKSLLQDADEDMRAMAQEELPGSARNVTSSRRT